MRPTFQRVWLAVILLGSAAAWAQAVPNQAARDKLIQQLSQDGYFAATSCREIASYVLDQHELPGLDNTRTIKGQRGPSERQRANQNPPIFFDSLTLQAKPYNWVKISATAPAGHWQLTVERKIAMKKDPNSTWLLSVRSAYHFAVHDGSCEFKSLAFSFGPGGGKEKPRQQSLDLNTCLDTFLAPLPDEKSVPVATTLTLNLLRKDCSIGMRYANPPTR